MGNGRFQTNLPAIRRKPNCIIHQFAQRQFQMSIIAMRPYRFYSLLRDMAEGEILLLCRQTILREHVINQIHHIHTLTVYLHPP